MNIEVFSDIACPWCFVGDRRLERALAQRPGLTVQRTWHPFQLQPGMPKGQSWKVFSEQKFGGTAQRSAAFAHVIEAGSSEGITFDFEAMPYAPNTEDCHRVVLWAEAQGKGMEMTERLFRAYFSEARDMNDLETLATLAGEVGLERGAALAFLHGIEFRTEVQQSQNRAAQLGVSGVPFYVFGGKYALSGAQPLEVFLRAIDLVIQEEAQAVPSA